MALSLARDAKADKVCWTDKEDKRKYIVLVNKTGELVSTDMEKTEILAFLPQFSTVLSLATSLKPPNLTAETGGMKSLPIVEDQVRDHPKNLKVLKSTGLYSALVRPLLWTTAFSSEVPRTKI